MKCKHTVHPAPSHGGVTQHTSAASVASAAATSADSSAGISSSESAAAAAAGAASSTAAATGSSTTSSTVTLDMVARVASRSKAVGQQETDGRTTTTRSSCGCACCGSTRGHEWYYRYIFRESNTSGLSKACHYCCCFRIHTSVSACV